MDISRKINHEVQTIFQGPWSRGWRARAPPPPPPPQYSVIPPSQSCSAVPVFTSRKLAKELKVPEVKPSIVNQLCVVYEYKCDSRGETYLGYTRRHLHQRTDEHRYSVIGKHEQSHSSRRNDIQGQFTVLKRCQSKFECLIHEMLLIRKIKPTLNTQGDSVKAKLFTIYSKSYIF